jgi:hypothetical protein
VLTPAVPAVRGGGKAIRPTVGLGCRLASCAAGSVATALG